MGISRTRWRNLELLTGWLTGWDNDDDAYFEADPVEASLHELGHVIHRFGSLATALRFRDALSKPFQVGALVERMSDRVADRNELAALAISFRVCEALGHRYDRHYILRDAVFATDAFRFNREKKLAKCTEDPRIRALADEIVRALDEE
jgi:hypothetical protein